MEARRFSSLQLQVTSVTDLGNSVSSILEVGPGSGYFASIAKSLQYDIKTADINSYSDPDYLGDFREISITKRFDLVAAFEMLQHIPYAEFRTTLRKLAALSNKYLLISVPSRIHSFGFSINIPRLLSPRTLGLGWLRGTHNLSISWEWPRTRDFDESQWSDRQDYWNVHYWEVGRSSYPRSRVLDNINESGLKILWYKYNPHHTHHLFVLAEKTSD